MPTFPGAELPYVPALTPFGQAQLISWTARFLGAPFITLHPAAHCAADFRSILSAPNPPTAWNKTNTTPLCFLPFLTSNHHSKKSALNITMLNKQ
jgi:hypothetical protein